MNAQTPEHVSLLTHTVGSKQLVVSFGGIRMGMGMPVFEFKKSLEHVNCDVLFVKDIHQAWYHKGIEEHVSTMTELEVTLKKCIKPYEKVCFLGNSMGGYAAILFGIRLNVDKVIAFSPQTTIHKFQRWFIRDKRWKKEIDKIYAYQESKKMFFDLKRVLKNARPFNTQLSIHYSFGDSLDRIHSERLKSAHNVTLVGYDFSGHHLVRDLKDQGELSKILSSVFKI